MSSTDLSSAATETAPRGRFAVDTALARVRLLGLVEGTTLLALLLVAVPLKHVAGMPVATSIVGPIHGLAFIAYLAAATEMVSGGGWSVRDGARLFIVALVPFGTFLNDRFLAAREPRDA